MRFINSIFAVSLIALDVAIHVAHATEAKEGHLLQAAGKPVIALAFSQDGRLLVGGSQDGVVSVWAVASNQMVRASAVHSGEVAAVAFSPNGGLIASGGRDRTLRVWTVGGRELTKLDAHPNGVSALAFSPDGQILASGGVDGGVWIWSTRDWTVMRRLRNHESGIRALRVSSNNQFLASGSDKSLRIWDLKDAAYSFDTFGERVRALSYRDVNPASRGNAKPKFASSDGNGIQLWQPSGVIGAHILSPWSSHVGGGFSDSTAEARVVAEENGLMATGWTNGVVEIRDENGYGAVRLVAHASGVESVTFSLGATNLASGGRDGTVKLWPARKLMDKANLEASQTRKKKER